MNKIQTFTLVLLLVTLSVTCRANNGHTLWLGDFMQMNPTELKTYWEGKSYSFTIDPSLAADAFSIKGKAVAGGSRTGLIYACYELARQQMTGIMHDTQSEPTFRLRILNHWDNLDGTIERGYAGLSIFWHTGMAQQPWADRIAEYARANASVGINGTVLNNVNANAKILTPEYLDTVRVIADILRPYGIKVYLSVNFASPEVLGSTKTADPLDADVIKWWKKKVKAIYRSIPDFGGFLVKANSEGQAGPFDYGRTHADGANMLADALKPFGGIVMWRSFVYGARHKNEDRVKQAVSEFKDLDGQFRSNVILQSKNGPLDFQPREPYAPIFDNMNHTTQMAELQITQEYTGQSKHLVYLTPMWSEFFAFVQPDRLSGIAGVSNVGDAANWCGHPFSQANWYAFGRLAWNPLLDSRSIAAEWLDQTFAESESKDFRNAVLAMMEQSRETCVDYMMPMGLHHIFKFDHHYGPEPDGFKAEYPIEWCPVYYHKADSAGIGFNRSSTGTGAVKQYREPYRSIYDDITTCPEDYLLWFHHVAWDYRMKNGRTLWQNLCAHYNKGVDEVAAYRGTWNLMRPLFEKHNDVERWEEVKTLLDEHYDNACEWRDTCLKYFQGFQR
jgi:alpha-glucuronidase